VSWELFLIWALTTVISIVTRQDPPKPKAATLKDLDQPTIEEGTPVGVLFGTRWVAPQELARWNLKSRAIKKKGGKK
jgi:hypothetical protein